MAMSGTRADLCMFGLAACDDGGPGFVNASVRMITNARQVGYGCKANALAHTGMPAGDDARVDAEENNRKEGAYGNMGAPSRQSNRGTTDTPDPPDPSCLRRHRRWRR